MGDLKERGELTRTILHSLLQKLLGLHLLSDVTNDCQDSRLALEDERGASSIYGKGCAVFALVDCSGLIMAACFDRLDGFWNQVVVLPVG